MATTPTTPTILPTSPPPITPPVTSTNGINGAGKTATSAIPAGYSYDASGKLTDNNGKVYVPPATTTPATTAPAASTPPPASPASLNAQQYGYHIDPNSGAVTYYDSKGNLLPTNPIGGDQYKLNPQATPNAAGKLVQLSTPPVSATGSGTSTSTGSANVDSLVAAQNDLATQATNVSNTIAGITNGSIPLNAGDQAQIDGLKQQFQKLIDEQTLQNTGAEGTANVRGYQQGAGEYDPMFQIKTIGSVATAGANKIVNLQTQEASAVASLTQALKDNDIKGIQDAFTAYKDANTATQTALKTTIADTQGAINDAHIANVLASGVTDPKEILQTLQDQGYTDISSKDIAATISNLSPDAANIFSIQKTAAANGATSDVLAAIGKATNVTQALSAAGTFLQANSIPDIQKTAAQNGAPASVIQAIGAAGNLTDALTAAGKYASTLSGDMAEYYQYTQDATTKGQVPESYTTWETAKKYNEAFATAKGTESGKAAGDVASGVTASGTAIGTTGSSTIDATVPGYSTTVVPGTGGLTQAAIDQDALATALGQPLPVPLGLSSTGAGGQKRTAINNRLAEINSGGNVAANKATLTANSKSLAQQVSYLNTTQRAFNTANDTLDALTSWMKTNGINASDFPDINTFTNYLKSKGIDPGAAGGYNAQISTLRAEYAQVLARGGTVTDTARTEASNLIPDGLSPAQLQDVADRIKVDANNVINDAQKQVKTVQDSINNIVGGSPTSAGDSLIQAETNAQNAVTQAAQSNSSLTPQITKLLDATNTATGQPYTYQEISQILGIQ